MINWKFDQLESQLLIAQQRERSREIADSARLANLQKIELEPMEQYDNLKPYKSTKENPYVISSKNKNYKIKIVKGVCKNYKDDNIEIRNILSSDFEKFLEIYDDNNDDIVIDFNKIFLNCGMFFNIKTRNNLKLELVHKTDKNYTIFQNNFFNFEKNSKVQLYDEFDFSQDSINNINYNIHTHEGADVYHNIFQNFSNSNKLFFTSHTVCEKKSSFSQNTYNFADGFVRNFHFAKL